MKCVLFINSYCDILCKKKKRICYSNTKTWVIREIPGTPYTSKQKKKKKQVNTTPVANVAGSKDNYLNDQGNCVRYLLTRYFAG